MKNHDSFTSLIKAISLAGLFAFAFSACDVIEDPTKELAPVDTSNNETVVRKVLLEEYTGHRCGNCPQGTELAHQLKTTYGDKLIILSIHGGSFANITPGTQNMYHYDFRTPTGTEMVLKYGVEGFGYPSGGINRTQDRVYLANQWPAIIDTMLQQPAKAKITIETDVDTVTRKLEVTVDTKFLEATPQAQNLSVYLVETGLKNWQKDYRLSGPASNIPDYTHKDFLRANLTNTWGNVLTTGPVQANHEVSKSFNTYTVPTHFDLKKCRIIAVVNHPTNYLIMQAEESNYLQ